MQLKDWETLKVRLQPASSSCQKGTPPSIAQMQAHRVACHLGKVRCRLRKVYKNFSGSYDFPFLKLTEGITFSVPNRVRPSVTTAKVSISKCDTVWIR
ncbi:hypothetical protein CEXT_266211 [Caerostris extrusa]|uniref:Uncharacterized protein n=1 Tax=Caerostris extrusa TaxID=172846 RepID=A0AAV4PNE6_CAEEX|nr:hypothetical protein CEXT_266211 [Caerostris extrusa]